MRLRRSILSIAVLSLVVGACSSSATPTPPAPTPTEAASAPAGSASAAPSEAASPSAEASAAASAPAASLPASFAPATTFTYKGSKAGTSAAFDMFTPARVAWAFTGSGPFTATIAPTGGVNNISTGTIANTTGRGSETTWIYGDLSKSNYTITTTGTGNFSITVMNPVAPAIQPMPVSFQSAFGRTTEPFQVSGDITLTYAMTGGAWDITLVDATTGASVVDAASGTAAASSSTVIHSLNGLYAFDITATGRWQVSAAAATP